MTKTAGYVVLYTSVTGRVFLYSEELFDNRKSAKQNVEENNEWSLKHGGEARYSLGTVRIEVEQPEGVVAQ